LLRTLSEYAPNIPADVRELAHHYVQTPLDLERNLGLLKGNIMHLDMSLGQMFLFRPLPELAYYKTPLEGLYLTGASTHPGGGVSGASGRNAAHAVLSDLAEKRRSWRGAALAGAGLLAAGLLARRSSGRKKGLV
jgi:phytoene dehydrogenase-like protein